MPSATPPPHRILLIDAYDSFTHNLSSLVSLATGATVHIIHIDTFAHIDALLPFLCSFHAVVIGPGPGSPENDTDVGIIKDIWHLDAAHVLPVFGVCLGLQSLCLAFGGRIERLGVVKHGLTSPISHTGTGLFAGVGSVDAVRYHSLHAVPPSPTAIVPLAWTTDENGRVLMAARHAHHPFYAVQYHPESICTEGGGARVIANFWRLACEWNRDHRVQRVVDLPPSWGVPAVEQSLLEQQLEWEHARGIVQTRHRMTEVRTVEVGTRGFEAWRVCEMLDVMGSREFVLLDSAAAPGRWSIIAVLTPNLTQHISYSVGDSHATLSRIGSSVAPVKLDLGETYDGSIWRFLAKYMAARRAVGGIEEVPFWGGLVGYFNYEIGVAALDVPIRPRLESVGARRPDVNLAFAERSIVVDGHTGRMYIQTLLGEESDDGWLEDTKRRIQQEADMLLTPPLTPTSAHHTYLLPPAKLTPTVHPPHKASYIAKVLEAQSHLAAGDSYELCITAQTAILQPRATAPHPWHIYTSLRRRNAAPYGAYLRLGATTLLSSSPERFLSWTRRGTCQLRPIKGTVRKTPTTTVALATAILNTPKERAENLMIVDLIRHDLHRVVGPTSVHVSQLMAVEEYATVFQLVSVIEGTLTGAATGFDVLATSLPPGSMTGAPKKRSVELLQTIEETERGVYSGVAGYWSVCGAGDWCVVIRSAVRYDEEVVTGGREGDCDVWRIGAGGAVTALSKAEDEWEEMETKLSMFTPAVLDWLVSCADADWCIDSTLRAFVG